LSGLTANRDRYF